LQLKRRHHIIRVRDNRGLDMRDSDKLDFSKLLGFDTVSESLTDGVDFQDPTVGARLGAKVGDDTTQTTTPEPEPTTTPEPTKTFMPMDETPEIGEPGEPVMRGSGGRDVINS